MPSHFDPRDALLVALGLFTIGYVVIVAIAIRRRRGSEPVAPGAALLGTGFVTNFLDTLGIGSFATTTAIFRQWKLVRDEQIPGTLNVGHTLPTIVEAFIFTKIVPVEATTLIGMIAAALVGAWLGAGIVARWRRRTVQLGMGLALSGFGVILLLGQLHLTPVGGDLLGLSSTRLVLGLAGNFVLGMLMTIGIGLYAPCMILVSLLGMNVKAAFPIMMGSCAFLMPVAGGRFIKSWSFDIRASLGLMIGGVPAVLIAAYLVKSLPIYAVQWLVLVVVVYTAANLLRAARRGQPEAAVPDLAEPVAS